MAMGSNQQQLRSNDLMPQSQNMWPASNQMHKYQQEQHQQLSPAMIGVSSIGQYEMSLGNSSMTSVGFQTGGPAGIVSPKYWKTSRAKSSSTTTVNSLKEKNKTAVSILNEFALKQSVNPEYRLFEKEKVMDPFFKGSIQLADINIEAEARTKKLVRQMLAQKVLLALLQKGWTVIPGLIPMESREYIQSLVVESEKTNDSPLPKATPMDCTSKKAAAQATPKVVAQKLHELAQKYKLPTPAFDFKQLNQIVHEPIFGCTVSLNSMQAQGEGKTKKAARDSACSAMLDAVAKIDISTIGGDTSVDDREKLRQTINAAIKPKAPKLTAQLVVEALKEHEKSSESPVEILKKISDKCKFEATMVNSVMPNSKGEKVVICKLRTNPIVICVGANMNENEAKKDAAGNTLQYLKLVASESVKMD